MRISLPFIHVSSLVFHAVKEGEVSSECALCHGVRSGAMMKTACEHCLHEACLLSWRKHCQEEEKPRAW